MASIDERVVSMAFENSQFEQRVSVTLNTLSKLDASIKNIGQAHGLQNIEADSKKVTLSTVISAFDRLKSKFGFGKQAQTAFGEVESAANRTKMTGVNRAIDQTAAHFSAISQSAARVDISGLGRGVQTVTNAFGILEGAAAVALGSIAAKAAQAGAVAVKSLSLGPVTAGLAEYEKNLNSIQTILANTSQDGTTLNQVGAALQNLNTYSDKTIYNFGQMADNIGKFTAAGVKLDTATESIKGIANLAALSGSSSEQAANAMYQLSQAIAAGKVNLQDWNSVQNAGLGGRVFQKALFDTAKTMGTITNSPVGETFDDWTKRGNNFRTSLSATQKAAQDGTGQLKKAQVESSKAIKDAHEQATESIEAASTRVTEAQKAQSEAIAEAAIRVRDAQQQAADDTKAAADKVTEAHKGVKDAAKQASRDIADAVAAQKEATIQSAADVKAALDSVIEARQRLADAMKPPSADELQAAADALTTAQLDSADLSDAITEAQREQQRSSEDLAAAQEKLAELQKAGASSDDILSATRAVEDAQTRATDASDAVTRATLRQNSATRDLHDAEQNLTDTKNKGTDADQNVKEARDALTKATDDYKEAQIKARKEVVAAEQNVRDVRRTSAADQKKAGADLAQAEKDQARVQVKAREDVSKAERDQRDTIIKARQDVAKAEQDQAKVIKDAREQEADAAEAAAERVKSARESMTGKDQGPPSWLTSDVLTSTLQQFTGEMTKAQLKAKGFTDAQADAILQTAKLAQDSATKVKTLSQLFGVVKESIGSGWAQTFQIIFGDFGEARKTFTQLSNYITGFTSGLAKARNKVLKDWKALGGRTELIEGLKNSFKVLLGILEPFSKAFRDVFPATTGKRLFELTERFNEFAKSLIPTKETMENLRRTFRGFFAAVHIGIGIVKGIVGVIFDLLGVVGKGGGGFLAFTGGVGDMVVALDNALTKGGLLEDFFNGISAILKVPLALLQDLGSAIFNLFSQGDDKKTSRFAEAMGAVGDALKPLGGVADKVSSAWDKLKDIFGTLAEVVGPIVSGIGEALKGIAGAIADSFQNIDVNKVLLALQTGLLAGVVVYLRKFFKSGLKLNVGGGVLERIKGALEGVTGALKAVQQNLQAGTLLKIGAAIGILALAIILLSTIEPDKLKKALSAIAVGLGELVGAMALLTKIGGPAAFATLPIMAAGLVLLASSVVILAAAMKIFATMDWEEIGKGLTGIAGALIAVGIGMKTIGATRLIPIGAGLILVGVALNIIAAAMKIFATMDWEDIGKGLLAIAGGLTAIGIGIQLMGPSLVLIGPGLIAAAFGVTVLAGAIGLFGRMKLGTIVKGIAGVAASVVILGLALLAMPPGPYLLLQGAGLIVVATGVGILAGAIGLLGRMKITTIVKGILAMGAALVILAVGLTAMAGTLPGSVALLAAAAAFAVLGPAIGFMGNLDWTTILKGLTTMALTLGVLAVGGLLAAPALAALGVAMVPLGLGLLAVAGAVYLAAKGLALLGDQGPKVVTALSLAISALTLLLPQLIINFVKGLVTIVEEIAKVAPKVAIALGVIIDTILATVIEAAPKVAEAVGALVTAFVDVIVNNSGPLIAAGLLLLVNFLTGIADNIGKVTEQVANIIVHFLDKLTVELPKILASGANLLVNFLKGIIDNLPKVVATVATVITTFLTEVTRRLPIVVAKGAALIVAFLNAIAQRLPSVIRAGVNVIVSFINGIGDALPRILEAGVRVIKKFLNAVADKFPDLVDAGFKAIIKLLNGIEKAIRENSKQIRDAGWGIADAIIDGILDGFKELWHKVENLAEGLADKLPGPFKKALKILSPSRVFKEIGMLTMEGLAIGLSDGGEKATRVVGNVANDVVDTTSETLGKIPGVFADLTDLEPTIKPVLDLTNVERGAVRLGDLTKVAPVEAALSSAQAANIASAAKAARADALASAEAKTQTVPKIEFNQTNTSPESLSDTEIYRQTKNQLGQLKRVLGINSGFMLPQAL